METGTTAMALDKCLSEGSKFKSECIKLDTNVKWTNQIEKRSSFLIQERQVFQHEQTVLREKHSTRNDSKYLLYNWILNVTFINYNSILLSIVTYDCVDKI